MTNWTLDGIEGIWMTKGEFRTLVGERGPAAPKPQTCAGCGQPIDQKKTGRPRKYCPDCVERLRHRTAAK